MSGDAEIIIVIEDVEVQQHRFVSQAGTGKADQLVEDGEGVAHGAIGFLGDDVQRVFFGGDPFHLGDMGQVAGDVFHGDPSEIEDLATGEDGGKDLVFFGGGQDELGVGGRLFQRFQEGVESRCRQHVDFVNDIDFVMSHLRRDPHLVDQVPDVIDRVIRGSVEFVDIERRILIEGEA